MSDRPDTPLALDARQAMYEEFIALGDVYVESHPTRAALKLGIAALDRLAARLSEAERDLRWERDEHDKARTEWLLMRDRLREIRDLARAALSGSAGTDEPEHEENCASKLNPLCGCDCVPGSPGGGTDGGKEKYGDSA